MHRRPWYSDSARRGRCPSSPRSRVIATAGEACDGSAGDRPTLTPELSEQIVALVRDVGALATAARCAGVPVRVAREWLARGLGNDPDRPCTPLYADFAHAVEKARGEFVARRIRRIEHAAESGTWTADAWAVERVDPDTWGRRDRVEVAGTVTVAHVEALVTFVVGLVERYVPAERRDSELADLAAVARRVDRATHLDDSAGARAR
jgi:hypothetical protein